VQFGATAAGSTAAEGVQLVSVHDSLAVANVAYVHDEFRWVEKEVIAPLLLQGLTSLVLTRSQAGLLGTSCH
jgi:hypothetical protein